MASGRKRRVRIYLAMMGTCLLLYVLSWTLLVRVSEAWAIAVSIMAMAIPPFAVIIANRGDDT